MSGRAKKPVKPPLRQRILEAVPFEGLGVTSRDVANLLNLSTTKKISPVLNYFLRTKQIVKVGKRMPHGGQQPLNAFLRVPEVVDGTPAFVELLRAGFWKPVSEHAPQAQGGCA